MNFDLLCLTDIECFLHVLGFLRWRISSSGPKLHTRTSTLVCVFRGRVMGRPYISFSSVAKIRGSRNITPLAEFLNMISQERRKKEACGYKRSGVVCVYPPETRLRFGQCSVTETPDLQFR